MAKIVDLHSLYRMLNFEPDNNIPSAGQINLFRINDFGETEKTVSYRKRDYFKISLVKGHSKIHYVDRTVDVNGTALIFTNTMIPFHWERISDNQSGYMCIFTEPFFSPYGHIKDYPVFQTSSNAIMKLSIDETERFERIFEQIDMELKGDYAFKYDSIRNLLLGIVHDAQKLHPVCGEINNSANAVGRITGLFIELLERQFPIDDYNPVLKLRTAADFADQLHIHINHLNKALKKVTGHTTMQLIGERIMQEARLLLKNTDWQISEISRRLAFEEPGHFSTFFKSHGGKSPIQFRQGIPD